MVVHFIERDRVFLEVNGFDGRNVGWQVALVVECHLAVTLEVHGASVAVLVHRQLLVVGTDSVTVSVGVREQARLKNWVG